MTDEIQIEDQEVEEAPKVSKYEAEALEQGWKPKEDFIAEGRDEEDFVSAKEFVRYGKLKQSTDERLNRVERETQEQIRNLNMLHEVKRQEEISQLKAAQKQAVKYADEDQYDALQQQIDARTYQQYQQPKVAPEVEAWEAKNTWIKDTTDPRYLDANSIYLGYKQANPQASERQALDYLDNKLSKLYPPSNPLRSAPTQSETGQRVTSKTKSVLSMDDLSRDEADQYKKFGHMFKDKKAFLTSVANARKS